MSRFRQIVVLVLLLFSLVANVGLLWAYSQALPDRQRLRQEADRQSEEMAALRQERAQLQEQVQTLIAEKERLQAENDRLREENDRLQALLEPLQNNADMLEKLDQLEAEVRALRRLIPPQPVARALVSRQELRSFLERRFAARNHEEEAAADAQVWALLGLLPVGTDLYNLLLDLYTEQVFGFYDLEEGKMYLLGEGEFGPLEKLTFVHEYVHAIQDQFFDLRGQVESVEEDADRSLALEALAEGDATLAMARYVLDHRAEISSSELLNLSLEIETSRLEAAPDVVQQVLLFPYEAGLRFVMQPYLKAGWAGVDQLWADPPQSTEQLLHPDRYPEDAPLLVDLPRLESALGPGWQMADEDTLGEFMLRLHLVLYLGEEEVDQAAAGWGGDHYALYVHPERKVECLVLRIVWDSRGEADEFVKIYQTFAEARYGQEGEGTPREGMWWPGLYLEQTGGESWLIWAPDRETATDVARRLR